MNGIITCKIQGGLGNQLFQIFAVMSYAFKHNWQFVFPYSDTLPGHEGPRYTAWNSFLKELKQYTSANEIFKEIGSKMDQFPLYIEPYFHFKELPTIANYNFLKIDGYFQSYLYFQESYNKIKQIIRISEQQIEVYNENKSLFDSQYTISMHFRLGDYKKLQHCHPLMPYKYYYNAIKHILSNIKDTTIQVLYFCEEKDNDLVLPIIKKLSLKFESVLFTKAPDKIPDWKQMLLMSCCDSHIIANSSFSWWGAYFNEKTNKHVCYPELWFGPRLANKNLKDLFPPSWNKIPVS